MSVRAAFVAGLTAAFVVGLANCAEEDVPPPSAPRRAIPPFDLPGPPPAALVSIERCSDTGDGFDEWLAAFREHAIAQGISRDVATHALADVTYDPRVLELDRAQRSKKTTAVTAAQFAAAHVTPARVRRGLRLLSRYADLLGRIEDRFGVAPEILVALWGLETDFGDSQGSTRSLDALATLAYDCRRSGRFRGEFLSALRLLQRGDLPANEMVGAWAGEVGQTQFLPSSYERFGVDFDGDGRVDLIDSVDDALASTASYLAGHGWHAHEGYGPGTPNLVVLESWNASEVYRGAVVLFAERLAGGAARHR